LSNDEKTVVDVTGDKSCKRLSSTPCTGKNIDPFSEKKLRNKIKRVGNEYHHFVHQVFIKCRMGHYYECIKFEFNDISL